MRLGETFFVRNLLTRVDLVFMRLQAIFVYRQGVGSRASVYALLQMVTG